MRKSGQSSIASEGKEMLITLLSPDVSNSFLSDGTSMMQAVLIGDRVTPLEGD